MSKSKHIVIDARIRRTSTGRPVDRLLEHLQNLDSPYKYTVLLEPDDPWKPRNRKFKTILCDYKIFSFNPFQQISFARQIYNLKPDLAHFTMTGQQPLFYFGPQITFTHDLTMLKHTRRGRLPKWLHRLRMIGYKVILWSSHRRAKKILTPSAYVKGVVQARYLFTRRKVEVTLEASEPPLQIRAEKPIYAPDDYILYVGTAFPHKNLRRLVNSFEIVLDKHPDIKLVLVGKEEYHSKKLQKWTKKKPYVDSIIFTGFVPDAELKWLYENAKAYVFPSVSEGFGLPGLEAMVHGCPVASSDGTCLPEIYGEAANYFKPKDIEDMAEKILEVIENTRLRNRLIEKGYEQAKKFSWKKMAEETLAIYDEILG